MLREGSIRSTAPFYGGLPITTLEESDPNDKRRDTVVCAHGAPPVSEISMPIRLN